MLFFFFNKIFFYAQEQGTHDTHGRSPLPPAASHACSMHQKRGSGGAVAGISAEKQGGSGHAAAEPAEQQKEGGKKTNPPIRPRGRLPAVPAAWYRQPRLSARSQQEKGVICVWEVSVGVALPMSGGGWWRWGEVSTALVNGPRVVVVVLGSPGNPKTVM